MKLQTGAALLTAMVSLLLVTILGVVAMRDSSMEARLSNNHESGKRAFNAVQGAAHQILTRRGGGLQTILHVPQSSGEDTASVQPQDNATQAEYVVDGITVGVTTRLIHIDQGGNNCRSFGESIQSERGPDTKACYGFSSRAAGRIANGANAAVQIGFYVSR